MFLLGLIGFIVGVVGLKVLLVCFLFDMLFGS